jgi:hypothetical protein
MLREAKKALRITVDAFDSEIMSLLQAGAMDLQIAGVNIPGSVVWTETTAGVSDLSDVEDPLVQRALFTYAAMRFGNPPNYDKLAEAYELQKVQLMHADGYTNYGGDCT